MPDPLDFAIDLDSVCDRLKLLNYFVDVRDLQAATEAIQDEIVLPPAAFASIANETAQPNKLIGGYRQQVFVTLSIVFAEQVQRAADDTRDQVEQTRKAIIRQLIGWTPERAERSLEYDRYLLRGMSGNVIWGECLFKTSYQLQG